MDKARIQDFCRRYFQATGTRILRDEPDFLQVELPIEIDQELTERPYYWMWVEATGQEVQPSVLNLIFDAATGVEGVEKTELVTLGSFRLEKIFQSAARRGQFVCQYQEGPTTTRIPFLLTSLKISYIADRRKDELRSYGVNLKNCRIVPDLYELIRHLPMTPEFPAPYRARFTQPQILAASLQTGWQTIKGAVLEEIRAGDPSWAEAASEQLKLEIEQLETYYQSLTLDNPERAAAYAAEKELRIAELKWRCQPRIQVRPLHFALLYLDPACLDPTQFTGTSFRM